MLEKIREGSQGGAAKIILGAVILSFALSGIYSYLGSNGQANAAAVNGEDITRYDLSVALQNEQSRLRQQMGEMFDTLAADPAWMANVQRSVLERMVSERLVDQKARELGLRVSDEQIKKAIVETPEFQVDGRFDNDRYQAVLRQINMTPDRLAATIGRDMIRQQLLSTLFGTEIVTSEQAQDLLALQQQLRDIRYLTIDKSAYLDQVSVGDEQVQSFYDTNLDRFATPEQVSLEYIELKAADLAQDIEVSDDELLAYYEGHQNLYQKPERRLAAMILIEGDRAKAERALARIKAGEAFADVAREMSDDFSAENGGELDWFERGMMDKAFDDALFALEKGGVSEILETEFGFQIVQAKEIAESVAAPIDDVKAEIADTVKLEKAQEAFYDMQQRLVDASFQFPDSLDDAAAEVGATIETSQLFNRFNAPQSLADPKVLNAAFSDAVVLDKMNSDVIELGSGHVIVVRAKEYQAAGTQPLSEVRDQILAQLKAEEASKLAQAAAEAKLAELEAGAELEGMVTEAGLARMGKPGVDPQLVAQVFTLARPADQPTLGSIKLSTGDYAIVALDKVTDGDAERAAADALKLRLAGVMGQENYQSLIDALRANAEISYYAAQ
ncbi:peptidylprolyl isomerase [Ferrimonas sediminicola]|uniref:Periplasmic chaperone PpiD n=1 Tax=Ferrimonas sediminicola TaxID=2569538 RepID=A0A4U1BIJ4_9GAMM|nr:SurA N-terminal domain-containing protein [Ferrimonas sediminicola]TKB49866.1 peptidylprolyl isomerase [Ferrimonas sediminicola]